MNGRIDVISDAICPWCYIGKRQMERALASLAPEGLSFEVHWRPFQLNPDMPKAGVERAAYRAAKFGSAERSAQLDAQVAEAGRKVGLEFRHDLMQRTPNTVDAHRLIRLAEQEAVQDAVVENLFRAYFIGGKDIGDPDMLAGIGADCGIDRERVAAFLAGEAERQEVLAEDIAARRAGLQGVPAFALDGHILFTGAVPADTFAEALREAHRVLSKRSGRAA
ncbi:MAG: DsbA family oxidoreductase [Acidisphaera sp.]|nr:DsbA family oxidoreductase [Acidisphaera sp.]